MPSSVRALAYQREEKLSSITLICIMKIAPVTKDGNSFDGLSLFAALKFHRLVDVSQSKPLDGYLGRFL